MPPSLGVQVIDDGLWSRIDETLIEQ